MRFKFICLICLDTQAQLLVVGSKAHDLDTENKIMIQHHLQLSQDEAHQVVMLAMRNIVGRDIRWSQSQQPGRVRYQKTNYQYYHVYADSDLSAPVTEITIE